MSKKENQNPSEKLKPLKKYLQLSGIAVQMGITIYLFSLGGQKLDKYYETDKEWFTIIAVLMGVFLSLYVVIKQLNRINEKNK